MSNEPTKYVLYYYTPSLTAAIVSVVAFAILTTVHSWKLCKFRTFYFLPFVIGGIFEALGYCGRIWGHFNPDAVGGYVMQSLLILLAPALFAASIYMILGRLIRALGADELSVIRVSAVTKIFVAGDVLSFMMQLSGGGLLASSSANMLQTGRTLIIAGLFTQIIFFGFFVITAMVFHVRARASRPCTMASPALPWQRHLAVLYVTSALILVRSIVRAIEYLQGNGGYLLSNEVFIYIFDMLLMVAVMAIFWVWYVADLQPRRDEVWTEEETLKI